MAAEDRRREKKINLAALKKLDKFAANILDTASSVAHYVFDAKSEEWEKTDFEGSLFVYNRNEKRTEVAFLILNRLKKENFHVTINPGMKFQTQDPFLLCKTSSEIIGIWFYNSVECERISALLSRISELADDEEQLKHEIDEALEEIDKRDAPKVDVLKLFTKAKEEYEKKHASKESLSKSASVPKFTPIEQKLPASLTRTNSVPDGIHEGINEEEDEGGISMASHREDSNNLMRLLQVAKSKERKLRSRTLSYGETQVNEGSREFKDHIKKLSGTKAGDLAFLEGSSSDFSISGSKQKPQVIDVAKLEASVLLNQSHNAPSEEQEPQIRRDLPENTSSSPVVPKEGGRIAISSSDLLIPAKITPTKQTIAKLGTSAKGRGKGLATALIASEMKSGENALPVGAQKIPRKEIGLAMKFPEPPSSGTVTSLMSPMQFTATAKLTASQSSTSTPELTQLDKQQFKDAFVYLLQNDDGFVEKLHRSYLTTKSKR